MGHEMVQTHLYHLEVLRDFYTDNNLHITYHKREQKQVQKPKLKCCFLYTMWRHHIGLKNAIFIHIYFTFIFSLCALLQRLNSSQLMYQDFHDGK